MSANDLHVQSHDRGVAFEINGERFIQAVPTITVRGILNLANVPGEDQRVVQLHDSEQAVFTELDAVITLTNGARFETIHVYVYFVDTERQVSITPHLSVREILGNAGVEPADHYLIELRGHQQVEFRDLDHMLHVRECEKFISIYHGPTPVS